MENVEETLYDIGSVCCMLGITSRTLRFYEDKKIISSTKQPHNARRQYTREQIDLIRNVLVLRELGFSVKDIAELQKDGADLKSAVLAQREQVYELIGRKNREVMLLNEALAVIESGGNIYHAGWLSQVSNDNAELIRISRKCAEAVVYKRDEELYRLFSATIRERMSLEDYTKVRSEVVEPLGEYVCFEKEIVDEGFPNIVHQRIKFEKFGLDVKLVFHNGLIYGIWFNYYQYGRP